MLLPEEIAKAIRLMYKALDGKASEPDIVDSILTSVLQASYAHMAAFWEYQEQSSQLVCCRRKSKPTGTPSDTLSAAEEGIAVPASPMNAPGHVLATQDSYCVANSKGQRAPGEPADPPCFAGTTSHFYVPITAVQLRRGVISVHSRESNAFGLPERAAIEVLGKILAVILDFLSKDEQEKEMMSIVSHQTIGPLSGIMGYCRNLRDNVYKEDAHRDLVYRILVSQAARAIVATQNLLQMSEFIRRGTGQVLMQECRLTPLLIDVARTYQGEAAMKKLSISVDVDACEIETVRVNEPLVRQSISNLIDNAVKYSDEGTKVRIWSTITSRWAKVTVENRGIGLDGADSKRVFGMGPASRTLRAVERCPDGTGIGLWLVARIMSLHMGKAIADPTDSRGLTRVHLLFPLNVVLRRANVDIGYSAR